MVYRTPPLFLAALVLAAFASRPARADDTPVGGKVVKVADGKVTLSFKGSDQERAHDVAKGAKITLDGKAARLEDLKEGYPVEVVMTDKHVLTRIDAHSKGK